MMHAHALYLHIRRLFLYSRDSYAFHLLFSTQSYYTKAKIPNPKHWCSDMYAMKNVYEVMCYKVFSCFLL